jgi:hypothetical protein
MSADGDHINSDEDAANMIGAEMLKGKRVDAAFATVAGSELVCVDSGCNKIILMDVPEDQNGLTTYVQSEEDNYLVTAAANGRLDIAGQGVFNNDKGVMHVYNTAQEPRRI